MKIPSQLSQRPVSVLYSSTAYYIGFSCLTYKQNNMVLPHYVYMPRACLYMRITKAHRQILPMAMIYHEETCGVSCLARTVSCDIKHYQRAFSRTAKKKKWHHKAILPMTVMVMTVHSVVSVIFTLILKFVNVVYSYPYRRIELLILFRNKARTHNKANLKDLIAATGLVILHKLDSSCWFFGAYDLQM